MLVYRFYLGLHAALELYFSVIFRYEKGIIAYTLKQANY